MWNTADVTGGKPIAVLLQSISRKERGAILLFCPDTTRDLFSFIFVTILFLAYIDVLVRTTMARALRRAIAEVKQHWSVIG
jgi:hypothetical protein